MEFQVNLTKENFRGKRANNYVTPCARSWSPTTILSQEHGTSLPFLLSSSLAGLVFLMK